MRIFYLSFHLFWVTLKDKQGFSGWNRAPDQCFRGEFKNHLELRLVIKKKTSKSCLAACLLDKNCSGYHHTSPEDCFLLMMTSP